jgi:hypothetical protein
MGSVRVIRIENSMQLSPCCRCGEGERRWDRIAGKPYCPNCQEELAVGEAPPLVERTERARCTICAHVGTVRFLTFPLHAQEAVEFDLCPEHLRALLGRRLGPHAYAQVARQLSQLGIDVEDVFLLHSAFYDSDGRALYPAVEVE